MSNRLHKDSFITDNFLLETAFAERLYHDHVKDLPIIDYHNHLIPEEIATNRRFDNCTQVWLAGDHYKWRAMRALGKDERYITGAAEDRDKFLTWAASVPYTVRNPLYHWTHLELKRYFNIDELVSAKTGEQIYHSTGEALQQESHRARGLLSMRNVEVICTTDDPADTLEHHQAYDHEDFLMRPTFRPDKALQIQNRESYLAYLQKLEQVSGERISNYAALLEVLQGRVQFFDQLGCKLADHGLEVLPQQMPGTSNPETVFRKVVEGASVSAEEVSGFQFHLLAEMCSWYHDYGWVQQFHLGAIRNNNSRMLSTLGADTGYDSIGDLSQAVALSGFLNHLEKADKLAKTVLYNLNPAQNEVFATMAGNFQAQRVKGKVQFGSAWWFLDQKDGMEKQLNALSNLGLISCFVGMLTDSRSLLSFPRHEYFRRIVCNLFGNDVAKGELPADEAWLGKIVADIAYHNAKNYFNFS